MNSTQCRRLYCSLLALTLIFLLRTPALAITTSEMNEPITVQQWAAMLCKGTLHEFGHFLDSVLGVPSESCFFYEAEAGAASVMFLLRMTPRSFSVSGGSQRTSYRLSLGYTGEEGILVTDKDKFDRINMSSFLSVDVNKWLTTQLDIRYANSTQNKVEQGGRNGIWGSAMQLPSYQNISPYEEDGITYPAETSATYIRYGEPRIVKKTDFRALGRIIISPLKNLKITGEYTYNRVTNYNRMYVNQYKYIGMNFTGVLNNTENTRYALTQGFNNYNAINVFANYDFSIGNHNIGVMGGFNQEENHAESQWTERKDV